MAASNKQMTRLKRGVVYREAIKANSLIDMAGGSRVKVQCAPNPLGKNHTILKGRINNLECHSNLSVHATDTIEVRDHEAKAVLEPAVTCSLILQGKADGSIGGKEFSLDGRVQPMGYIWAMNEATLWTRRIKKNSHVRKVNITVDRNWLLQEVATHPSDHLSQFLIDLMDGPVVVRNWQPTKRALSLAEQLLQPSKESPFLNKIHTESRALEILCEALEVLTRDHSKPEQNGKTSKAQSIRDHIEANIGENVTLASISSSIGMAVNTMQRIFKQAYDMTVMDYIRERRLEIAKEAMERDGLTIAQAAFKAGYNSPANFSTAFKRVYGFSPSSVKH